MTTKMITLKILYVPIRLLGGGEEHFQKMWQGKTFGKQQELYNNDTTLMLQIY